MYSDTVGAKSSTTVAVFAVKYSTKIHTVQAQSDAVPTANEDKNMLGTPSAFGRTEQLRCSVRGKITYS